MVPPNKLGPDLNGKAINETQYRGMIGSLMYLTASRSDIQFSTCLVQDIEQILRNPTLLLSREFLDSDYARCNMDRKSTTAEAEYVVAAGCCANILWMKSQFTDYDIIYEKVPIFCDNTRDIELHFIPTQYPLADIFTKPLDEPTFKRLIVEIVLAKVGKVAYRLELPQELSRVHHTFHVSNLKKCYADEPLVMPLEGIHVDDKLQFVEEPVEIMEREIKRLKRSRIPLVKVRWNSRRGPEFTWEREDSFKQKYPQLFTNRASSSTT
ncbi:hypothetical protein Tco_1037360, partial [Tanacetum coccineum]